LQGFPFRFLSASRFSRFQGIVAEQPVNLICKKTLHYNASFKALLIWY
jgi:hypothetical protein